MGKIFLELIWVKDVLLVQQPRFHFLQKRQTQGWYSEGLSAGSPVGNVVIEQFYDNLVYYHLVLWEKSLKYNYEVVYKKQVS